MKESLSLRFLYGTVPGRSILKVLTRPAISRLGGFLLSTPLSACFVPWYIRKHQIDMTGVITPEGGFHSFNDFFTRKREIGSVPDAPLVSPCDGFLTALPIGEDTVFTIKNSRYRLEQLLGNRKLAERYRGGTALILRLTPNHYHRYTFAADGKIAGSRKIPGVLHCVRPIALAEYPVFTQNAREYTVIRSEQMGPVVQMEIGALMVGRIENRPVPRGSRVQRGDEKGNFAFGGSTIVVLVTKGALSGKRIFWNTDTEKEQDVRMLQPLADFADTERPEEKAV